MHKISNIFWLGIKELRSFLHDFVLLGLVIYAFSLAIISHAQSYSQELHNASIGMVDEDHSELSRRITHAFLPPYFQPPQPVAEGDIVPLMNSHGSGRGAGPPTTFPRSSKRDPWQGHANPCWARETMHPRWVQVVEMA